MILRFRAQLKTSQPLKRPIQTFHISLGQAVDWSKDLINFHPDCKDWGPDATVEVYEMKEELVKTIVPEPPISS